MAPIDRTEKRNYQDWLQFLEMYGDPDQAEDIELSFEQLVEDLALAAEYWFTNDEETNQ